MTLLSQLHSKLQSIGWSRSYEDNVSIDVLRRQLMYSATRHARHCGRDATSKELRFLATMMDDDNSFISLTIEDLKKGAQ